MQSTNPIITGSAKKDGEAIKLPILIPLFASILLLLIIFTFAIYRLQQKHINDDVQARLDSVSRYFNQFLASDAKLIGETTHFVKDNPDIQNTWLAKDRNALLTLTTPIFEKLRQDYKITHLYFIDVNQTCFLRVHNPTRFGDRITRFTLESASGTKKTSWGIELGPYGTFTLRVVQPWFVNNTLTGFVEFGEEIDHITPQLKSIINVDLAFLIDKSLLNRDDWQEGLKIMGRTGDWDLMPNCVIADSTTSDVPPEFVQLASLPHEKHRNRILTAKLDGSTFSAGFVKLSDTAGHEVGDILVIKNITKEQASLHMLLAVVATVGFLIASALVSFFYTYIAGIEKHITEAHASLETEIEKRKEVEILLRKHKDNLEDTVKERTGEIEQTNKYLQEEIVERQKAENAMRKSEERFKQVTESAGDWIWEVNAEGLYTYSSHVVEKVLGYKPEEIVGKKYFYDLFTPQVKEEFKKAAFETFNKKKRFSGFINPNIHKNGSIVILETTGTPILDNEGNLCGYRGADRDITERKQAEEELKYSLSLLSASLESTADGILIVNRKGKLTRWNQKFADMWKIPEEILAGRDDGKTINHILAQLAAPEQFVAKVKKLYEHPEESSFDQIKFLDGRVFDRYSQPQRIGDDIVGRVWSFLDVTKRKQAEEKLLETNRRLQQENEQRIRAEKSLEILNANLESTITQLSRTNKQLGEFAHLTAHDLKTPLRGIGTLAQWLYTDYYDKFDDNGRRQIDLLVKRVKRMDNIINAILQYSTITKNKTKERKVDLNVLTKEIISRINPPENIKITINKTLPVLMCEEEHLWQIFLNLISNAVKFSDKPQTNIIIDVEDEKCFWKFSVADNGPGIEPRHFDRIFQLFQMLDGRDDVESEGIGLTLAKKIVELYDGKIWLTSKPGEGSTFFFTLPKQMTAASQNSTSTISHS
jgi:two-component system, LuxR family, sensor kinase FixL